MKSSKRSHVALATCNVLAKERGIPSDSVRTFRDLPVVDANRIQQECRHETRHTTTHDTDLLILFTGNECRIRLLGLEIGDTVKPCTVRIIDGRQGVSLGEIIVGDLDGFRGADDAQIREGVQASFGRCVFGGDPDEPGSESKVRELGVKYTHAMNSRHVISSVSICHQSTDFMVCLRVVIDTAVSVNEDDVTGQGFRTIVRDVEVVRSTSLNTSRAESRRVSRTSVKPSRYSLDKADGR